MTSNRSDAAVVVCFLDSEVTMLARGMAWLKSVVFSDMIKGAGC